MNDISGAGWQVMFGSCLDRLPELADNSIDAVVTDPPYELGFMGKSWDSSGIAFNPQVWAECLRVLKPGGHLLAFGGSRTWHRIAVAIEDAGFEVRDSIAWLYGSGFPKSLDISKAIDKAAPRAGMFDGFAAHFAKRRRASGLTQKSIAQHFPSRTGGLTGCVWNWENGANVPTVDQWKILQPLLELSNEWLPLIERVEAEREVIGQQKNAMAGWNMDGTTKFVDRDITLAATEEAKKWSGWGTALKPAFEPVIVARKPLIGTVAANVLAYGTGGLNIDGSRIGTGTGETRTVSYPDIRGDNYQQGKESYSERGTVERVVKDQGRWPANVILDPFTAELLDEQSEITKSTTTKIGQYDSRSEFGGGQINVRHPDSGGASRFFYVAKASKRDRNEGLDGLEMRKSGSYEARNRESEKGQFDGPTPKAQNFHPTVKPTDLMRYLVKLVTPPGGTVLDPFTGSGSTGKAAILEGFEFIGCELTDDYLPIIEGRLSHAADTVIERGKADDEKLF